MAHSQNVDLKRLLHECKDKHSQSLFEHLCNMLTYIDNNTNDPLVEDFETLSQFLSSTRFVYKQHPPAEEVNNPVKLDQHGFKAYYNRLQKVVSAASQTPQAFVQDFAETNCDWNIAGYGFQEEEALILHSTLERLASEHNCDSIRFLGIIRGSQQDYFVIYGRLKHHVQDHLPEDWEPNGKGVNALTFWVSNDTMGPWTELPAIGPHHVVSARGIKRAMTGNLDAKVVSYPEFKGTERHFLKAQLVRILHNCEVAPTGMYRPHSDEKKAAEGLIEVDPDYNLPDAREDLGKVETWVHFNEYILKGGRTTYFVPKSLDEAAADALKSELQEKDPTVDRFKAISEDKPVETGQESAYITRLYGDKQQFNLQGKDEGKTSSYEIAVIQSQQWPGFFTIVNLYKQRWSSLYLGLGLKANQKFIPDKPKDFSKEPNDLTEVKEPHDKPKVDTPDNPDGTAGDPADPQDGADPADD